MHISVPLCSVTLPSPQLVSNLFLKITGFTGTSLREWCTKENDTTSPMAGVGIWTLVWGTRNLVPLSLHNQLKKMESRKNTKENLAQPKTLLNFIAITKFH